LTVGNHWSNFGRRFPLEAGMKLLVSAAALALSITTAAAQMTGQYKIEGKNPDGSSYSGTARVEKTGDTWRVTWNIDGTRFVGTGIGSNEAIAIGYRNGSDTGVALLGKEGDEYGLVWTYIGGRQLGVERWTRE
jgi:hypothetical protein